MVHRVGSVTAIVFSLLTIAAPASAKLPPFDTEVSVDGNTATITIRFDDFYESGELAEDFLPETLEGLFAVYSIETLDASNRPQATASGEPVTVTEVTPGVYRGSVEVEHAGEWAIVAFPDAEISGPPFETTVFTVPGGQPVQLIATVGVAALVAGTLLTVLVRRRRSALSLRHRTTSA